MDETKPLTCSTCQHWNRKTDAIPLVGQPATGICRGAPPQIHADGSGGLTASYVPTLSNNLACGMHKAVRTVEKLEVMAKPV